MDAFNIEKWKIHLNHEPRGKLWDINVGTSGNFRFLSQDKIDEVVHRYSAWRGHRKLEPQHPCFSEGWLWQYQF